MGVMYSHGLHMDVTDLEHIVGIRSDNLNRT